MRKILLVLHAITWCHALTGIVEVGSYPGSNGIPAGGGLFMTDNATGLIISGEITHLMSETITWHIHTGTSCAVADEVGGHYFPGMANDPWTSVSCRSDDELYCPPHEQPCSGSCDDVDQYMAGFSLIGTNPVMGHAVVVHDAAGVRIGCGVIHRGNADADTTEEEEEEETMEETVEEMVEGEQTEDAALDAQELCEASHPFDPGALLALKAVTIVSAVLSVLGSLFIVATWLLQRGTRAGRGLGLHVIFFLSISDLLSSLVRHAFPLCVWSCVHHVSLSLAVPPHVQQVFIVDGLSPTGELYSCSGGSDAVAPLCTADAAGAQFFGLATVLWTGCIAVGLHLGVLRRSKLALQQPTKLLWRMHFGVWSSSALALIIMFAANTLGPTGQWCWVRLDAYWAMLVFYYIPLIAVFAYSMCAHGGIERVTPSC